MCSISCENVKYVSFDSLNFKEREKINSHPLLDLTKSFSNEGYGPVSIFFKNIFSQKIQNFKYLLKNKPHLLLIEGKS